MLDLGPHAGFIIASYGIAVVVLAIVIGLILIDHRTQKRALAALEARGVRRRSNREAASVPGERTDAPRTERTGASEVAS